MALKNPTIFSKNLRIKSEKEEEKAKKRSRFQPKNNNNLSINNKLNLWLNYFKIFSFV